MNPRPLLFALGIVTLLAACEKPRLPTDPTGDARLGPAGGAAMGATPAFIVAFPAGALASPTEITVEELPTVHDPDGRVVPGTAHELAPLGIRFAEPVTIRIEYDPASLPEGVSADLLRIHELVDGEWIMLADGFVDPEERAAYANTTHFSTYALLPAGFSGVDTGERHACGIAAGEVWCWGDNTYQQLGTDEGGFNALPTRVRIEGLVTREVPFTYCRGPAFDDTVCDERIRLVPPIAQEVTAATYHTCARVSIDLYCWGANFAGQIGNGTWGEAVPPTRVLEGVSVADVEAGHLNTCAYTERGLHCWGSNGNGQLGTGPAGETCGSTPCFTSPTPIAVSDVGSVDRFDIGLGHICAIQFDNASRLSCWGWNAFGQVGTGSITDTEPPTVVQGRWISVSAGGSMTCALAEGGDPWCWGTPYVPAALGRGTGVQSAAPGRVAGNPVFSSINTSDGNWILTHTCAVGSFDRSAYCWGSNHDGELGVETAPDRCSIDLAQDPLEFGCAGEPLRVATTETISAISTAPRFTCADGDSGRILCWGNNELGQLGDGTTVSRSAPAPIAQN